MKILLTLAGAAFGYIIGDHLTQTPKSEETMSKRNLRRATIETNKKATESVETAEEKAAESPNQTAPESTEGNNS